jgi:2-methylcitrate dehydratase
VKTHSVKVHPSSDQLPIEQQLAYKLAQLASYKTDLDADVVEMIANRIVDNASVSMASLNRAPIISARNQALAHSKSTGGSGAKLMGLPGSYSPEWAAWANSVAVRELDYHDTFLAADYSHPGDNIPPILAVAQHLGIDGKGLARGIAVGYEVQIALVKAICLHKHKIDHVAHLGPSVAAGISAMLELPSDVTYHAISQALHTTTATRQSRKGEISTWKAFAPGFAGKVAIEAVDRAMRGQTSPSPIYEGEDGVIAWMLDGKDAHYEVELPEKGEALRGIMLSYTKEHSAEYQAQALIDLARKLSLAHPELQDPANVESILIYTSHHTHNVIGSGANDPEKYSPTASRETLDHSIPYIFTVALQDASWHHVDSYLPERAQRPDTVALWQKTTTAEDPYWTKRYHSTDPNEIAFGGRVEIRLTSGDVITDEIAVADAHPQGARPFGKHQYEAKLRTLGELASDAELDRFMNLVYSMMTLNSEQVREINIEVSADLIQTDGRTGIF